MPVEEGQGRGGKGGDPRDEWVEAGDARLDDLLQRCARVRRRHSLLAAFDAFSRPALPGVAATLPAALLLRMVGWSTVGAAVAALGWVALCWAWTLRRSPRWLVPEWRVPAYVDRAAGARGALMQIAETGGGRAVTVRVLTAPLPRRSSRSLLLKWGALLTALILSFAAPRAEDDERTAFTPIPVERARDRIEELRRHLPADDPFVRSADETLARLAERRNGLEPADLAALDRVGGMAERELAKAIDSERRADRILADLEESLRAVAAADHASVASGRDAAALRHDGSPGLAAVPGSGSGGAAPSAERPGAPTTSAPAAVRDSATTPPAARASAPSDATERASDPSGGGASDENGDELGPGAAPRTQLARAVEEARRGAASTTGAPPSLLERVDQLARSAKADATSATTADRLAEQVAALRDAHSAADGRGRNRGDGSGAASRGPATAPLGSAPSIEMANTPFRDLTFEVGEAPSTVLLDTPRLPQREESGDPLTAPVDAAPHSFTDDAETPFRERRVLPRHRAVVRDYFSDATHLRVRGDDAR